MKNWLKQCPEELKPVYNRRYLYDIFALFSSRDHLNKFRHYLNKCHLNMNFFFWKVENGKLFFLDIGVF